MIPSSTDTIFAFATAPIRSGVAVLRISGQHIPSVFAALSLTKPLTPRMAQLVVLRDSVSQELIDEALALYFPAPHSFTGEDVLELHIHGSKAVMNRLLGVLGALPSLRLAEAGEFSRRAFINGKMDLIEAEGLADLIDAETTMQARQALRQMRGDMGRVYEQLRIDVLRVLALLEAYMDFPDEDIPESVLNTINDDVKSLCSQIETLLADEKTGERIRDGVEVIILGAPNAGKSSLLNAIAKRDVAIVSPEMGTTRDMIEVHLNLGGCPVTIIDTAGLRDTEGYVEKEGIKRALERAENASIIIELYDLVTETEFISKSSWESDISTIKVGNKLDICSQDNLSYNYPKDMILISTVTGQGIDKLITTIKCIASENLSQHESVIITRERHRKALEETLSHLARFDNTAPIELNGEECRRATHALGRVTGKVSVDDVLDIVFSTFCIGK